MLWPWLQPGVALPVQDAASFSAPTTPPRSGPRPPSLRSTQRQRTTPSTSTSGPASTISTSASTCAGRQPRRPPRPPPVGQPGDPLGVVAVHPVPERLPVHPAALRRRRPIRSLHHQRDPNIRRACAGSDARHASRRNSIALCSVRSIAIAMPVPSLPRPEGITFDNLWESLASQQIGRLV